jgi:hypothetical protein
MTPPNNTDYELGRLAEAVEGLKKSVNSGFDRLEKKVDGMDGRLRHVEQKSAVYGSVAGGVVGVTVSLITASIKQKFGV